MAYNNDRRDRRKDEAPSEFIEKVVSLNRVSKTVKGGRVAKFSALCVVGDGKGRVGFGMGKANEVSEAIRKGLEDAKKNICTITLQGTTIPHKLIHHIHCHHHRTLHLQQLHGQIQIPRKVRRINNIDDRI